MKLMKSVIAGALLLAGSVSASNATMILVQATGTVTSSYGDGSGFLDLPYGNGVVGMDAVFSYLIDLNLAPENSWADVPGIGVYSDACNEPGPNWIQTLGITIGGKAMPLAGPSPANRDACGDVATFDLATQTPDRAVLNGERYDLTSATIDTATGVLTDGTKITKETTVRSAVLLGDNSIDFIHGTGLDQTFLWTRTDLSTGIHDGIGTYAEFAGVSLMYSCVPGEDCDHWFLMNWGYTVGLNTVTAQLVNVPEPGALGLMGMGLVAMMSRRKRGRKIIALAN